MKYKTSGAKDWVRENLRGYVVTATTPFRDNGTVDEAGLRANVEHILQLPGTTGIYVGSIYQEFWTLTHEERRLVTATVVDAVDGRVPVIAGATDTSARTVVDLAKHAESVGADLVMIWPPYYGDRTDDGVLAFYHEVALGLDIGICIYSTTLSELGFYIRPQLAERVVDIDNICAIKEASLSLAGYTAMVDAVGTRVPVSCPLEEYFLYGALAFGFEVVPKLLLGSSRPLYAQTAERPYCQQFFEAMEREDVVAARAALAAILATTQPIHSRYLSIGRHNVGLTKYITGLMGMVAGPVRPPSFAPSEEDCAIARRVLADNGLLDPSASDRPLVHLPG